MLPEVVSVSLCNNTAYVCSLKFNTVTELISRKISYVIDVHVKLIGTQFTSDSSCNIIFVCFSGIPHHFLRFPLIHAFSETACYIPQAIFTVAIKLISWVANSVMKILLSTWLTNSHFIFFARAYNYKNRLA